MITKVSNFRNHVKVVPAPFHFLGYEVARIDVTIKEKWWKKPTTVSVSVRKEFCSWWLGDRLVPPSLNRYLNNLSSISAEKGDMIELVE